MGALPVVDILSVPHTAHQWHTTACVLCLLAVPILSHCVRHCLLLVTIRMRPLQKGSTNLDHTEEHCHWSRHGSQVFTLLEAFTSIFFKLCLCVLCYSFAHSLTPCLSFCIISPRKKALPTYVVTAPMLHACCTHAECT